MNNLKQSICLFSHSPAFGGAEKCLIDLIKILLKNEIKCSIIIQGKGPLNMLCEELNIPVKTYDGFSWWGNEEELSHETIFKNIMIILQNNFQEITEFIQNNSTNVIYSQTVVSPLGAIFAEYLNLPHFWGIREFGELDHKLKFSFSFKKSMEALFKTSQSVLSVSKTVSKVVLEKNHFHKKVKINYLKVNIPDNYNNSYFKPFNKIINIGIFGTINQSKNQLDIIKATLILLEKGYKIKLFIVGYYDSKYYELLNQYIKNSNYSDHIIFTGHTENPFEVMKDMNIIISCSISEGFGRTLIEAILLNIPIIYPNSGTPKEIYKDYENGLAYTLYDELNLVDKIVYTVENIEDTKNRVKKAYNYVANYFTEERYSKPIIEAISQTKKVIFDRKKKYVTNLVLSTSLDTVQTKQDYIFKLLEDKNIKKIFFGASNALEKSFATLSKYNIYPNYICDNNETKHGKYFEKYKIRAPNEVLKKNNNYMIIITSSYIHEIKEQLSKYDNIVLIESYWDFITICSFDFIKNKYILKELKNK